MKVPCVIILLGKTVFPYPLKGEMMNKAMRVALALVIIGACLLLPAILGMSIYTLGMGGVAHAACMPNVSFLVACISGTYVLLSTATGGIMWVVAFIIGLVHWAKGNK